MARPRLPDSQLSKWGVWKRNERAHKGPLGNKFVLHHEHAQFQPGRVGGTKKITRSAHAAHHNRLRRKRIRVIRRSS